MSDALDETLGPSVLETLETLDAQDPAQLPSISALQDALRTIQLAKQKHPTEKAWLDEQHNVIEGALVKAAAPPAHQSTQEEKTGITPAPLQSDLTTAAVESGGSKPTALDTDQADVLSEQLFDEDELAGALAAYREQHYLDEIDSDSDGAEAEAEASSSYLHVCMSCPGSEATLADLEELCAFGGRGLEAHAAGCFGACGAGPNVSIVGPATADQKYGSHDLHSFVDSLAKAKSLVEQAAGRRMTIPKEAERRMRLRSDAVRLMDSTERVDIERCERLLTDAIECELADEVVRSAAVDFNRTRYHVLVQPELFVQPELLSSPTGAGWEHVRPLLGPPTQWQRLASLGYSVDKVEQLKAYDESQRSAGKGGDGWQVKLRQLRMLRSEVRGGSQLRDFKGAVDDLDLVIHSAPHLSRAVLEKAKVLRRAGSRSEALQCFREALKVADANSGDKELGLDKHMVKWVNRAIGELEERAEEDAAVLSGEFGAAHAGDQSTRDSGDGSGRWKVVKIQGYALDSAVYELRNHAPAQPHPLPTDAWHVNVRCGSTVREYTPISTAAQWEAGLLSLLVKTYGDGKVSKKFALLRQENDYDPPDEQNCWLLVSKPILTLTLPSLRNALEVVVSTPRLPISHLALVVGGTGIAPAVQMLRTLQEGEVFEKECQGTLLYSSRTAADALCIDELRAVQACGTISVRHTLTDQNDGVKPKKHPAADYKWVTGRHYHFTSQWQPFKPAGGPLGVATEEAGLRGRIDSQMLEAQLPAPGTGVVVVVCGPPSMWEDMKAALLSLGHQLDNLVELKALSEIQINDRLANKS